MQKVIVCTLLTVYAAMTSNALSAAVPAPSATTTDQTTLNIGPLKFTAGPQSDGAIGATLKGGLTDQLWTIIPETPNCLDKMVESASCDQLLTAMTFSVDAAWSSNITGSTSANANSRSNNKNNATITLDPSIFWLQGAKDLLLSKQQKAHETTCANANTDPSHPNIQACQAMIADVNDNLPFRHLIALDLYPDLEYRYGTFNVSGKDYTANQFVYGGGVRALVPTKINGVFANWPYIGVSYTNGTNYGSSNLPISAGTTNRYLNVNERVELNINWLRESHGIGLLALVDFTQSHPTGSTSGANWQSSKLFQLIVDNGNKTGLKAAVTYRIGTDKGLVYDRQVIFGVLWDIWSTKAGN